MKAASTNLYVGERPFKDEEGSSFLSRNTLFRSVSVPQTRRKAREKKNSGASLAKCAVLGMCNNNGSDSRGRICTVMHGVGFIMEPGGRAEPEFLRVQLSLL